MLSLCLLFNLLLQAENSPVIVVSQRTLELPEISKDEKFSDKTVIYNFGKPVISGHNLIFPKARAEVIYKEVKLPLKTFHDPKVIAEKKGDFKLIFALPTQIGFGVKGSETGDSELSWPNEDQLKKNLKKSIDDTLPDEVLTRNFDIRIQNVGGIAQAIVDQLIERKRGELYQELRKGLKTELDNGEFLKQLQKEFKSSLAPIFLGKDERLNGQLFLKPNSYLFSQMVIGANENPEIALPPRVKLAMSVNEAGLKLLIQSWSKQNPDQAEYRPKNKLEQEGIAILLESITKQKWDPREIGIVKPHIDKLNPSFLVEKNQVLISLQMTIHSVSRSSDPGVEVPCQVLFQLTAKGSLEYKGIMGVNDSVPPKNLSSFLETVFLKPFFQKMMEKQNYKIFFSDQFLTLTQN